MLCMAGMVMIFAQQATTPATGFNIGNGTNVSLDNTSAINQTTQLLVSTTSSGSGAGIAVLFVIAALVTISALAYLVVKR